MCESLVNVSTATKDIENDIMNTVQMLAEVIMQHNKIIMHH